jgi:hypothetical protein
MFFLIKYPNTESQFVFSHITKTGGSSIRGGSNIRGSIFNIVEKSRFIKPDWTYIFSFSICRNPYDRFLSAFSDFKDNRNQLITLHNTIDLLNNFNYKKAVSDLGSIEHHLLPQTHELFGTSKINHFIHFEKFNEELCNLFPNIISNLIHNRKSKSSSYKQQLTQKDYDIISLFYRNDFQMFDYKVHK